MKNIAFVKQSQKKGFTLAEVLVTLAIIGVVAALTIPTLIASTEKRQWETNYKKTFSTIKQATVMIIAENNGTILGAWGGANDHQGMYNAYLPYLKTVKNCENLAPKGNCFASDYSYLTGTLKPGLGGDYSVILSDGASICFWGFQGAGTIGNLNGVYLDINGKKGPNVMGKDLHSLMVLIDDDPVQPNGRGSSEANIITECPSGLNSGKGSTCGVRILRGDFAEDY